MRRRCGGTPRRRGPRARAAPARAADSRSTARASRSEMKAPMIMPIRMCAKARPKSVPTPRSSRACSRSQSHRRLRAARRRWPGSFSTSHGGSALREPSRISAICFSSAEMLPTSVRSTRDDAQDDQRDEQDHDHGEHGDRQHLAPLVRHAPDAQPRREDVHQLVDQQSGQQRGQQMQHQHQRATRCRRESRRRSRSAWGW